MTLLIKERAPGSLRTRRLAIFGLGALSCIFIWQFVRTGVKVADVRRLSATGQILGYNEYMWDSAQNGLYFILAYFTIFILSSMILGPLAKSNRASAALLLVLATPAVFFSVWRFYWCQKDIVMEFLANKCMASSVRPVEILNAGMFSLSYKCARRYAYDGHHVEPLSSRYASNAWLSAMSGTVTLFLITLAAAIRRPAGPALTGQEDHKHPDEAQMLDDEKV